MSEVLCGLEGPEACSPSPWLPRGLPHPEHGLPPEEPLQILTESLSLLGRLPALADLPSPCCYISLLASSEVCACVHVSGRCKIAAEPGLAWQVPSRALTQLLHAFSLQ